MDLAKDSKNFDVPNLIMHDDDQILPRAPLFTSSKIVKDSTLKIYRGLPHRMLLDVLKIKSTPFCLPSLRHENTSLGT